nr:23S rRNA (adenine(1618)-N(6))-methyltransferase RlmF [uncultured Holophaga sp.]
MGKARQSGNERSSGLHPRTRFGDRYDLPALVQSSPGLAPFVFRNPYGDLSVDFADPGAVRALNRALLVHHYGIRGWEIPPEFLCPPIPGRADYIHVLADLLAESGTPAPGAAIRVLDVGVGASCIYPILGQREYGWHFVGSDTNPRALASVGRILAANPDLGAVVELRRQHDEATVFRGVIREGESFELTLCNPPFHASPREAREGSQRKWRNLGKRSGGQAPVLNFGGQASELWCPGGEAGFIRRMMAESAERPTCCLWFTTLVSKSASLPGLKVELRRLGALEIRVLEMAQGQKRSRALAWTFLEPEARRAWIRSLR